MKSNTKTIVAISIVALLVIVGGIVYSKAVKPLPPDNAQLTELKFDNLMGSRYTEILLVFGNALTHSFTAGVNNTAGLNGANPAGGGDSSPAAILDKIDIKKVQEDNGALSTVKNGPRLWTVKARWVMWFPIPDAIREGKDLSYAVMDAKRDTSMGIRKGSRAYILDDPEGNSWVMKSASLIKNPLGEVHVGRAWEKWMARVCQPFTGAILSS